MVDETSTEITGNMPKTAEGRDVERTVWSALAPRHVMKYFGRREETALPWMAFHFLPAGKIDHSFRLDPAYLSLRLENCKESEKHRLLKRLRVQGRLICAPGSKFAEAMIRDTINIALLTSDIRNSKPVGWHVQDNYDRVRAAFHEAKKQNGGKEFKAPDMDDSNLMNPEFWRRFAVMLLGIRLHVLADTFAHQGFSGYRTKKLNDARDLYYEKKIGKGLEKGKWMDVWDGRAPSGNVLGAHIGHGRVGTFPDEAPWKFAYVRGAYRSDLLQVKRNNPEIYAAAAQEMWLVLNEMIACLKMQEDPNSDSYLPLELSPEFFGGLPKKPIDQSRTLLNLIQRSAPENEKDFDIHWWGLVHCADPKITIKGRTVAKSKEMLRKKGYYQAGLLNKANLSYFDVAAKYHKQWFKDKIEDFVGVSWKGVLETIKLSNMEEPLDEEESKMFGGSQVPKKKSESDFEEGDFFEFKSDELEEKKGGPKRPSVIRELSRGEVRPRPDSVFKNAILPLEEKLSDVEDKYKAGVDTSGDDFI